MSVARLMFTVAVLAMSAPAMAQDDGLIFRASMDRDFRAERAGGDPLPNFRSGVAVTPDGAIGGAARWADEGYVAWRAPGNMLAQRGTLSFFWRPREPLGTAPFVIWRTGFADHSSWDMTFLRIDWNGHGFDAFVTDANLARVRVSWTIDQTPDPDQWRHLAFAWDETTGVRLYVGGREVARKDQRADLDIGLDQFGLAGRIISPHQVQSRYNFMRGSDVDEIRVYDRMLPATGIATLAAKGDPTTLPPANIAGKRRAWLHRFGWDQGLPPTLDAPSTRVRKVEIADAWDIKQWMWKGVDGIAETTWPGVYNRSRLAGRNDYFPLPDWNTYVEGGKRYDLDIPATETFNRVEIRGAAHGTIDWAGAGKAETVARRPKDVVRSVHELQPRTGGRLSFANVEQEQPIQEIWTYHVSPGAEPAGSRKLSYVVDSSAAPDLAALDMLNAHIIGRFPADERSTVVALPAGGVRSAVGAGSAAATGKVRRADGAQPIVHVLIPSSFGDAHADRPLARAWDYGWRNAHDGLDGIAIDLPGLNAAADGRGLVPLNIRVRDPLWPGRDLIDLSVSVRTGVKRTLWLDLRDRILTGDSLLLSIASAAPNFDADALNGAAIRLVFKDRAAASVEHVADRFRQVKDNWGFLVEEHTASQRAGLYRRLFGDVSDLLRVAPDHVEGRRYWADINYQPDEMPAVALPAAPAGVPEWAFRQLQDLSYVRRFVSWWIDQRQSTYGDFGGGLSDDSDLVQQWPGLALMGIEPDKINASLRALSEAVYRNGMMVGGLGAIATDELHAYEEGLNADAARLYLNWGEPRTIERLMATTRALEGVVLRNPAGHLHFASNWYGAGTIVREGAWEWQKPYSFTVMHGPMLLGLYNGSSRSRTLVTGLVDGWMAHAVQSADGGWSYPNEVNWRTDQTRAGDGGGANTPLQSVWAAWRFTGDDKYLRPIQARMVKSPALIGDFNENAFDLLPGGIAIRDTLAKTDSTPLSAYAAFAKSADLAPLTRHHAAAAADKAGHEYMFTEGHWWSDRVEQPSEILQRERLGGIALRRNQTWPGNTVSWRFGEAGAGEQVAILVPGATRERFRVIAHNVSARRQAATMTTWNIVPGRWRMRSGISTDDGRTVTSWGPSVDLSLERSASADVAFDPGVTTVLDFELLAAGVPIEDRPDLGIGTDDVTRRGRDLAVVVHSLGERAAAGGRLSLIAADGGELAQATIPALSAPTDLLPKTAVVRLRLPPGAVESGSRLRVSLIDDALEVTLLNNEVALQP